MAGPPLPNRPQPKQDDGLKEKLSGVGEKFGSLGNEMFEWSDAFDDLEEKRKHLEAGYHQMQAKATSLGGGKSDPSGVEPKTAVTVQTVAQAMGLLVNVLLYVGDVNPLDDASQAAVAATIQIVAVALATAYNNRMGSK